MRTDLDRHKGSVDWHGMDLTMLDSSWLASIEPWCVHFILADNALTSLPDPLFRLRSLQILNVSSNSLEYVPASVFLMPQLQKLILKNNRLTSLPGRGTVVAGLEAPRPVEEPTADAACWYVYVSAANSPDWSERFHRHPNRRRTRTLSDCLGYQPSSTSAWPAQVPRSSHPAAGAQHARSKRQQRATAVHEWYARDHPLPAQQAARLPAAVPHEAGRAWRAADREDDGGGCTARRKGVCQRLWSDR